MSDKAQKFYVAGSLVGSPGKTAYQYAVEKGYTGTEEEFAIALASINHSELPDVTEKDDGKILKVIGGKWIAEFLPTFDGDTEVTPSQSAQTLSTSGKMMVEDVTINPIPYAEVSNNSGGKTVTIGGK